MSDTATGVGLTARMKRAADTLAPVVPSRAPEAIGALAVRSLTLELETWPKPGLVSHIDNGSHGDMDAFRLRRSATALRPFFTALAQAGSEGASMEILRGIGMEAERAMLTATFGVNTHRGAIFGLGLLCAAAGLRGNGLAAPGESLGGIVAGRWGHAIATGPIALHSHGTRAARLYGATGARGEAVAGFPGLYRIGLPALAEGDRLAPYDAEAGRVHAIFALIASLRDTNLLHRGGPDGLAFARSEANTFMRNGGIGRRGWRLDAAFIHAEFVKRRLSPGGSADLLAMSLFAQASEAGDGAPR